MAEYKINYTQSNFTGGIIAAELYGRNDFNKVKTGLKKCTNWTIREAGGLEFRRGTRYLQTVPVAAGTNFKIASLDSKLFFFCEDGIRYIGEGFSSATQKAELQNPPFWFSLAYNGTNFVALGLTGYISTSADGETWTPAAQNANLGDNTWHYVTYGNSKFVALGAGGYISYSTDGVTWSTATQNVNLGAHGWRTVTYDGAKFVALSTSGYVSTSTDGTTWTSATQNTNLGSNDWQSIAYGNSKFVAIARNGYVSTSTDGTTWSAAVRDVNLGSHIYRGITYDGTKFIAIGNDGYISSSADGITWAPAMLNTNLGNLSWMALAVAGTKVVALDNYGYISISDDNQFALMQYPAGIVPNLEDLHFTELKRRLYYYDGAMKMSEIVLSQGLPFTKISTFETAPTGCSISSTKSADTYKPTVYVEYKHEYTFSLAKDSEHETLRFAGSTYQNANIELTQEGSDSDNKGQQVNVTITLTADQASTYSGGKIYLYKKYQGYFYFLTTLDISSGTTSYKYNDKGQFSPDVSKTPKTNPGYINNDGSITAVNSIADYNQRLFLTRTNNDVTQIIFSAIGETDQLAYTDQRSESEAGNLELPISNYDSWCKVTSGLDLVLSTSYTISKVSGYGDLVTETVLWDGLSHTVDPVRTRRSLIYTNTSNRNIYDLTYNEYGQYDSIDLTLLIKYIFEEKTIKRLAFKDYPVKTIYVLCTDGELYCLTYIKDQNIYAWYKIEHAGSIYDLCVVNADTEDEVYIVVNYDGTYVLEQAYHRTDNMYLDCALVKQLSEINDNTITGLDIFEGKKVRVFDAGNNLYYGDYDIMNPQTVIEGGKTVEIDDVNFDGYLVTDGTIELPADVELIGPLLIGLPYYAVAETIPLEFSDQNGNSTIGRKKAVNEAYLRYGDSRGLTYKTMGHEYDCGICERDIADNAQFLERGQVKLHTVSEYKWDSTIKILQRQPYPARIESITLGLTFNDKS